MEPKELTRKIAEAAVPAVLKNLRGLISGAEEDVQKFGIDIMADWANIQMIEDDEQRAKEENEWYGQVEGFAELNSVALQGAFHSTLRNILDIGGGFLRGALKTILPL